MRNAIDVHSCLLHLSHPLTGNKNRPARRNPIYISCGIFRISIMDQSPLSLRVGNSPFRAVDSSSTGHACHRITQSTARILGICISRVVRNEIMTWYYPNGYVPKNRSRQRAPTNALPPYHQPLPSDRDQSIQPTRLEQQA